jgi:hypothetical protein
MFLTGHAVTPTKQSFTLMAHQNGPLEITALIQRIHIFMETGFDRLQDYSLLVNGIDFFIIIAGKQDLCEIRLPNSDQARQQPGLLV